MADRLFVTFDDKTWAAFQALLVAINQGNQRAQEIVNVLGDDLAVAARFIDGEIDRVTAYEGRLEFLPECEDMNYHVRADDDQYDEFMSKVSVSMYTAIMAWQGHALPPTVQCRLEAEIFTQE